jgi:hypothetical protein
MNKPFLALVATGILFAAHGCGMRQIPRPDVPDNPYAPGIKVPPGEKVILMGHATGVQIYACQPATNTPFAWVFKAPEADLTDSSGKKVIHHFTGPMWTHIDGSGVVGKVAASQDAPKPAIPWLLLTAVSHVGQGVLTRVTYIQRVHTEGGMAPEANTCDASASGKESRSPYSADYYFYAPEQ